MRPRSRNTSLIASFLIVNDLYQQENASFKPVSLHASRFGRRSNQLSSTPHGNAHGAAWRAGGSMT